MKAVSVLIVLALISQIYTTLDVTNPNFKNFKCPEEKTKLNGICAIQHLEGNDITSVYIFDKCGQGKRCKELYNGVYTCQKDIKFRKIGESCKYNRDCYSLNCVDDVCVGATQCTKDTQCSAGKVCALDEVLGIKTCMPGTKDGTFKRFKKDEDVLDYGKCARGLYKEYKVEDSEDGLNKTVTCIKMASLEDGKASEDSEACKSGIIFKGKCDSIQQVDSCPDKYTATAKVQYASGGYGEEECKENYDWTSGNEEKIYIHKYSDFVAAKALRDKFLADFEGLNVDDLLKDEKKAHMPIPLDYKVLEKYYAWKYGSQLYNYGIIDAEGEPIDNYQCEYEFFIKAASSSSLKLSLLLTIAIALLGF